MKKVFIATLVLSVFALTACDNAAQKRRQACTDAQNTTSDFLHNRPGTDSAKYDAAINKWKELQCHQSDVITH
ncbi:hypothetical protein [Enterobacter asburiae]|uniref:hypothetical protein n=1 Tax=Enterobacter asburiae TaxID=61645 RepID=UPI003F56AAD4